ncbi:MAG: pyruvate, water dikinase regulatory protein [Parasphingopyxis sp.]|uniref:pyruvate, water dikinase regulatory protein n=1 Tax=Parasphingopyxis sp. TaxID=1920299 RepID=UPI003F9FAF96
MIRLHLHLISDSTGETLENIAKAGLAQFDDVETIKHFWPMVRSEGHLDRVLDDIGKQPGLVLYTLVDHVVRRKLEMRCRAMGLPAVSALDPVIDALSRLLGMEAKERPGRQHALDAAYFQRVEAIQYTIAHDDGVAPEDWDRADIVLAGVSRTSKTPTSIYLANRGYKVANVPLVPESPPPDTLYRLKNPVVIGLTTSPDRLVQVRRNRLLSLNQTPETDYVDRDRVKAEVGFARRIFADNDWPVIDVTRRSIEESAAAILNIVSDRANRDGHIQPDETISPS